MKSGLRLRLVTRVLFATFRSALDRLREFPGVAFVASSAQLYEWVAEADPAMFEEIRGRVLEGRWNVVGGWWIEPDLNCPGGESLVRQGLYGQRFFRERLGRAARVGFNPDSFGHPWTLPQILRGQGLEAYVFMRPGPHEKPELPAPLFRWEGPDGTRILAIQILESYNDGEWDLERRIEIHRERFEKDLPSVRAGALFYGVGNHGGGPTVAAIRRIHELASANPAVRFGSLDGYVDLVQPAADGLPVVRDELQHHARGCYSAEAGTKALNRQSESALLTAEKTSSLATALLGLDYPSAPLRASWKKVLFNQFHDILAGSSIEAAYVEARQDYGYALSTAADATTRALHRIAEAVGHRSSSSTPRRGRPVGRSRSRSSASRGESRQCCATTPAPPWPTRRSGPPGRRWGAGFAPSSTRPSPAWATASIASTSAGARSDRRPRVVSSPPAGPWSPSSSA